MKKAKWVLLATLFYQTNVISQSIGKAMVEGKRNQLEKSTKEEIVDNPEKNFKSFLTDIILGGNGYYQALLKNGILKQSDGEIQIKSTIYGIIRIFDPTKQEEQFFKKLRWARNTQIGLGTTFDDKNAIKAINSSFSWAIINKRVAVWNSAQDSISGNELEETANLIDIAFKYVENMPKGLGKDLAFEKLEEFGKTQDFSLLKNFMSESQLKSAQSGWTRLEKKYEAIKKSIEVQQANAPVLAFGYEGNYDGSQWKYVKNKLEYLKGVGSANPNDSIQKSDIYLGAFYEWSQDTIRLQNNLSRQSLALKFGINRVLARSKSDGSSLIEAYGGAEFQHINAGALYADEKENTFKADVTFRFRLASNLYLPFQVKYNVSTGRFEGYLDLKFDVLKIFR